MVASNFVIEARNIQKKFGHIVALRDANLRVAAGEVHGLLGANGAGKSTFVKILTGAIGFGSGSLCLNGQPFIARSPAAARRAGLVSIYQEPSLVPHLTIAENVKLTGAAPAKVRSRLERYRLGSLNWDVKAKDLSLPIRRMIDIARALASDPKVVFFDEATAALSAEYADMVFDEVRELQSLGVAVVFISHRLGEIEALCQRSTVLRDGVVAGVVETSNTSSHEIVALMLGRSEPLAPAALTTATESGPKILEVHSLTLGSNLRNVSLSVRRGEVVGLAALEGQGQDQLFECLAGLRAADEGTITISQKVTRFAHPADAIDAGVALIPAEREQALLRGQSVEENVWLPKLRSPRNWGFISTRRRQEAVAKVAADLSIDMRAGREVRLLSGGNQQKVVIARWLCLGFDVLLCFDPTRGIDVGAKQQIFDIVRDVASKGAAVLYFTSDLTEIQQVADRTLVLFGGRLVKELSNKDSTEAQLLEAAHGLSHAESFAVEREERG